MAEPLYDPVALAEIALLAEVVIAAGRCAGRLTGADLDEVLGLGPGAPGPGRLHRRPAAAGREPAAGRGDRVSWA